MSEKSDFIEAMTLKSLNSMSFFILGTIFLFYIKIGRLLNSNQLKLGESELCYQSENFTFREKKLNYNEILEMTEFGKNKIDGLLITLRNEKIYLQAQYFLNQDYESFKIQLEEHTQKKILKKNSP